MDWNDPLDKYVHRDSYMCLKRQHESLKIAYDILFSNARGVQKVLLDAWKKNPKYIGRRNKKEFESFIFHLLGILFDEVNIGDITQYED